MSDKILSQEEVDALLNAMNDDEIDLKEEGAAGTVVKSLDLINTSTEKSIKFKVLQQILNRFVELSGDTMSVLLQKNIIVEHATTEIVKFEEFTAEYKKHSNFTIFTMDPLLGKAMMVLKGKLASSLIDCMMGGRGEPVNKEKEFTQLESRLINKFCENVLQDFENSWKNVFPISTAVVKIETNPEYIHILSQSEAVVKIAFTIKSAEFEGDINFCMSYLMLELVKDKLSEKYLREKETDPKQGIRLKNLIYDTKVDVVAELGTLKKTVHDLLNLQVDDIIRMKTGPQDFVTVKVEGIPKYIGEAGVVKGNKAVEISQILQ